MLYDFVHLFSISTSTMILYPKDIKEKIEYSKIIDTICSECLSGMAVDYFRKIEILTDLQHISQLINETDEYKKALQRGEFLPIATFESVTEDVQLVRKEGYVLEIESIKNIYKIVAIGMELVQYFSDAEKVKMNPLLSGIVSGIVIDKALTKEIDRVLDEEGEVRPNASEELLRISKQIKSR